jgi:RimJ/RimL family protein N-acetyltransferase
MYEFLALPDPYTAADARRFVTEIARAGRSAGNGLGCAVVERATGRLVGSANLDLEPRAADGEIGYWIAPDARGNGYAAEATGLLTTWAFALGVQRIRLLCDVRNGASLRTAMAAGFAFEGVARSAVIEHSGPPRRCDAARFALLPTDVREPVAPIFPPLRAPLADGVLGLRMVGPEDAQAMAEADDAVAVGWGFTGRPEDPQHFVTRAARADFEWLLGRAARFAMVDLASGASAGFIDLMKFGPPEVGRIGYTVHPRYRGNGYTARALHLLARWAFDVAGFARLELGAKSANIASQRAAETGGFDREAIARGRLRNPDGTFSDEVVFARLRGT